MPKQKLNDRLIRQIGETYRHNISESQTKGYAIKATAARFHLSKSTIFKALYSGVR